MAGAALGWVIEAGARASLLLAAAIALGACARRAPAGARHLWWASALAGALAVAPLSPVVPSWRLPILPSSRVAVSAPQEPARDGAHAPPAGAWAQPVDPDRGATSLEHAPAASVPRSRRAPGSPAGLHVPLDVAALGLWAIGFLSTIGWLLCGLRRARGMARKALRAEGGSWHRLREDIAARLGLRRTITLLISPDVDTPVTWGWLRPLILMPSESSAWCPERRRLALAHEMAHVRRNDWLAQILAHLACSAYWFVPMAWMARQRLRLESEKACDELVVELGTRPSEYASHLLEMSESVQPGPLAAVATLATRHRSHVEARIMSILSIKCPVPRRNLILGVALAVMAGLIGSVSSVSPWAEPQRPSGGAPASPAARESNEAPEPPESASDPLAEEPEDPEETIGEMAAVEAVMPVTEAYQEAVAAAMLEASAMKAAYQEAIAAAMADSDSYDRTITRTEGDAQYSIRFHGRVEVDGEGRITSMEPASSMVLEALTNEHQIRLEVTQPEKGARVHDMVVNGHGRPFDEIAARWMTAMLGFGMSMDGASGLWPGAEAFEGATEALLASSEAYEKLAQMQTRETSLQNGIVELRAHQEALRGAAAGMREQLESLHRQGGKLQDNKDGSRALEEQALSLRDQLRQLEEVLNTTVEHQVREMELALQSLHQQQEQPEPMMQLFSHDQGLLPMKEGMFKMGLELKEWDKNAVLEAMTDGPDGERARRLSEELRRLTEQLAGAAGVEL